MILTCFLLFSPHRVSTVRARLAAAVPLNDQILLLGPPYKVPKDATLQSEETIRALQLGDEEDDFTRQESRKGEETTPRDIIGTTDRSGARRLFLFSKQALSENAPDPPVCTLEPLDIILPTEAPGSSPVSLDSSTAPPLHQALTAYERQFMLYLAQGRELADGADLRFAACRTCVQEQIVMARSMRAAVSNLSDHYHGAARTRAEFTTSFTTKTAAHGSLLQRFETIVSNLANISLHPALVGTAQAAGRTLETLLDTVPVEREQAWAQQCQTAHQRLLTLFSELDTAFTQLGTPASREEEVKQDRAAEEETQQLWTQVEGEARKVRDQQAERLARLTAAHRDVVQIIVNAINTQNEDEVQNAFTPLREMSNSAKELVPAMVSDDNMLKQLMEKVADAKTRAMKRMKWRLREVSIAQSSIQRVLASVGVLREALAQQTENMQHLEHVSELPNSYRAFLTELRRRRAYGQAVGASSASMMERLATMRDDEVKAREKFLRGPGRHLMPAFYDVFVPTLATPPPLFTPQMPAMVELDTLPNVGTELGTSAMQHSATAVTTEPGNSSASTLTADTPQTSVVGQPPQPEAMIASAAEQQQQQQQSQLIVSADEHSSNELLLDPAAAAKTLAYENVVLREALERLGGKAPHTYVEEARTKDGTKAAAAEVEVLRKELEALKAASTTTTTTTARANDNDKISHSSFDIGDVGLFMPLGRGPDGKRMYLAFHTCCPHRYLSTDCVKGSPDYVLGRIVYQEELVAGEVGTDANPYGLHVGTPFWVLTVEVLYPESELAATK